MGEILQRGLSFFGGGENANTMIAALEKMEIGAYVSALLLVVGLLGFVGMGTKKKALWKSAGLTMILVLFPSWLILGPYGALGFLVGMLLLSLILNKKTPANKGEGYLKASLFTGFILSVATLVLAALDFWNLDYIQYLDPATNGIYSVAPLVLFLLSYLVMGRKEKKLLPEVVDSFEQKYGTVQGIKDAKVVGMEKLESKVQSQQGDAISQTVMTEEPKKQKTEIQPKPAEPELEPPVEKPELEVPVTEEPPVQRPVEAPTEIPVEPNLDLLNASNQPSFAPAEMVANLNSPSLDGLGFGLSDLQYDFDEQETDEYEEVVVDYSDLSPQNSKITSVNSKILEETVQDTVQESNLKAANIAQDAEKEIETEDLSAILKALEEQNKEIQMPAEVEEIVETKAQAMEPEVKVEPETKIEEPVTAEKDNIVKMSHVFMANAQSQDEELASGTNDSHGSHSIAMAKEGPFGIKAFSSPFHQVPTTEPSAELAEELPVQDMDFGIENENSSEKQSQNLRENQQEMDMNIIPQENPQSIESKNIQPVNIVIEGAGSLALDIEDPTTENIVVNIRLLNDNQKIVMDHIEVERKTETATQEGAQEIAEPPKNEKAENTQLDTLTEQTMVQKQPGEFQGFSISDMQKEAVPVAGAMNPHQLMEQPAAMGQGNPGPYMDSPQNPANDLEKLYKDQEEYYLGQSGFFKTQADFYKTQIEFFQKQIMITQNQFEFYQKQTELYYTQAEFYKNQRNEAPR